ncbi:MAG: ATP-dependent Clp protease adaptor ClpS [Chlorobi bacterium]|nr:ATP-dependent Clp protease adaptor ClpS [Chlorobiota bacterium]
MKTRENLKDKTNSEFTKNSNHFLILHNDDVNSFDFVIESLIDICQHKMEQAEQCAFITHYKGKCDIKKGVFDVLVPIKDKLAQLGLSVTID